MSAIRKARPQSVAGVLDAGRCPDCGKIRYLTRRDARRRARALSHLDLSAYECGGYWHLGHLPTVIARGRAPRPRSP